MPRSAFPGRQQGPALREAPPAPPRVGKPSRSASCAAAAHGPAGLTSSASLPRGWTPGSWRRDHQPEPWVRIGSPEEPKPQLSVSARQSRAACTRWSCSAHHDGPNQAVRKPPISRDQLTPELRTTPRSFVRELRCRAVVRLATIRRALGRCSVHPRVASAAGATVRARARWRARRGNGVRECPRRGARSQGSPGP